MGLSDLGFPVLGGAGGGYAGWKLGGHPGWAVGGAVAGVAFGVWVNRSIRSDVDKAVDDLLTGAFGPTAPPGWTPLRDQDLTPDLRAKAREILATLPPIGSMTEFVDAGERFGGFATWHGEKRAIEIWRPV